VVKWFLNDVSNQIDENIAEIRNSMMTELRRPILKKWVLKGIQSRTSEKEALQLVLQKLLFTQRPLTMRERHFKK